MKKILLITTIALFGLYVQPAYSLEIDYNTGQMNNENPGNITQTPDYPTMEFGGEAGDSGLTAGSGTQTDSGGTDDSGDDTSGTETTSDTGGTDDTETTGDTGGDSSGNEVVTNETPINTVTPFACDVFTNCEALGFTIDDTEKCDGRIALPCPFDENLFFCSKPENSAIKDSAICKDQDKVLVSGACVPKCPEGATRSGLSCDCGEGKLYVSHSNICVCTGGRIGVNCDLCYSDFELSPDGTKCVKKNENTGGGFTSIGTVPGSTGGGGSTGSGGGGGGYIEGTGACGCVGTIGASSCDDSPRIGYEAISTACRGMDGYINQ